MFFNAFLEGASMVNVEGEGLVFVMRALKSRL